MKTILMMAVAALAGVAVADGPAAPEGGKRPVGMRPNEGFMMDPIVRMAANPKFAEKIGLTAEQQTKAKTILDGQREAGRESQEKLRVAMTKQTELLKAEKVDEAAVMAAIDEVFEVRKEMAKAQTKRVIAVKSLLTPEQVQKALDAVKEMRPDFRNRRGPGEGRKFGPRDGEGRKAGLRDGEGRKAGPRDGEGRKAE